MAFNFRRFAPLTMQVEAVWSTSVITTDVWTATGVGWGHTNTKPIEVKNAADYKAVQKPGNPTKGNLIPAREKIAADLAYIVGLPVPPVVLRDIGGGTFVAISGMAFETSVTWGQAKGGLGGVQGAALIDAASAMLPFEAWIDAQDRHNEGNVLIGLMPSGEPIPAWIDYAFSMDLVWGGNLKTACTLSPVYPPVGAVNPALMTEVAERILAIKDEDIEGVVKRIPRECLPEPVADIICQNLLARRAPVRALC